MLAVYRYLLLAKFAGVLLFVGGAVAALAGRDRAGRHHATHRIASPGLLLTWGFGYALVEASGVPLTELWVALGLLLSLAVHVVLIVSVDREGRRGPALVVAALVLAILALMVWKPQW